MNNGLTNSDHHSNQKLLSNEDTVDRAAAKVLEEKFDTAAPPFEGKDSGMLPRKITEEFLVNNNLPSTMISAVSSHPPSNGVWNGVTRGSEEERDSKYEGSTIDSEPPSFSSSVTEDVELVLPGSRRFGVAKDDLEEQVILSRNLKNMTYFPRWRS